MTITTGITTDICGNSDMTIFNVVFNTLRYWLWTNENGA